jgi:hypothetical protein
MLSPDLREWAPPIRIALPRSQCARPLRSQIGIWERESFGCAKDRRFAAVREAYVTLSREALKHLTKQGLKKAASSGYLAAPFRNLSRKIELGGRLTRAHRSPMMRRTVRQRFFPTIDDLPMKHLLVFLLLLPHVARCELKSYTEFAGKQVWPTGRGAEPVSTFAAPVYRALPERPYLVLGAIHASDDTGKWAEPDTAAAADLAKTKGGDALLLRTGEEISAVVGPAADPHCFSPTETGALVIKWRSQTSIDERAHRLEGFRAYLRRSYPRLDLDKKDELWSIAVGYVAWLGLDVDSQPGAAQLEDALSRLVEGPDSSSRWLYRETLRSAAATGAPIVRIVYGFAKTSQTGEDVTISSESAGPILRFSGQSKDGRLKGEITGTADSTGFSGKVDGELAPGKMLLRGEGQVADRSVQAEIVYFR